MKSTVRVLLLLALASVASAARKEFKVCFFPNADCSGEPVCDGNQVRTACSLTGKTGLGVRATCGDNRRIFLYPGADCSGRRRTYSAPKNACVSTSLAGVPISMISTCFSSEETPTPTILSTPSPALTRNSPAPTPSSSSNGQVESSSPSSSLITPSQSPSVSPDASPDKTEQPSSLPSAEPTPTLSFVKITSRPLTTPNPLNETAEDLGALEGSDDGSTACFDSASTVEVVDGSRKELSKIVPGDYVESVDDQGRKIYSEVFLVQHAGMTARVRMLDVVLQSGILRVTPKHYLRVPGSVETYITANNLSIGDKVLVARAEKMMAQEIRDIVPSRGAPRNIHTMNDRIVVEGVLASCISANSVLGLDTMHMRALLAPLKLLHRLGMTSTVSVVDNAVYAMYNKAAAMSKSF